MSGNRNRAIVRLVWMLAVGVLGGGLVLLVLDRMERVRLWGLIGLLIALGLYPLFRDWRRDEFDLFNARNIFVALFLMHNAVWTAHILLTGLPRFLPPVEEWTRTMLLALVYALFGLATFYLGYSVQTGRTLASRAPKLSREWNWPGVQTLSLLLLLGGTLSYSYLMFRAGGVMEYVSDLGTNRTEGLVGRWYFVWGAAQMVSLALIVSWIGFLRIRSKLLAAMCAVNLAVLLGMALTIGYRSFIALPLVQMALIYHYLRKRQKLTWKLLAAGAAVTILMVGYAEWRNHPIESPRQSLATAGQILTNADFWAEFPQRMLQRFYGLESFAAVLDVVPSRVPLEWGKNSFVEILTAPVPRAWWPDKIVPLSIRFSDTFFPGIVARGEGGVLTTWLGEMYWNFHVGGILLGSFLLGIFCRFCYEFMRLRQNPTAVFLYSYLFVLFVWLEEAPTDGVVTMFSSLIPAALCLFFVLPAGSPTAALLGRFRQKANHLYGVVDQEGGAQ
jgi:oligosaccharide repeat unit polymerase